MEIVLRVHIMIRLQITEAVYHIVKYMILEMHGTV